MNSGVVDTNFPDLKLFKKGKVRDVYDLGASLLMVATDRISTGFQHLMLSCRTRSRIKVKS
jgi:hypothetical protein